MPARESSFAAAVRAAISGATVATGNRRAARQLMAAAEHQMRQQRDGWLTPDVLPLEAWLRRTWSDAQLASLAPTALLNPAQALALWESIVIERLPQAANPLQTAQLAADAWRLAHDYEIAIDSRQFPAFDETRAFQAWAREFGRRMAQQSWTEPAELTAIVVGLVPALAAELPSDFVFYGFDELTPARQALVAALRAAGKQVSVLAHDASAPAAPRLVATANPREELYAAARWALQRLRRHPAARLGVVVTQMEERRAEVEMAFTEVLHPDLLLASRLGDARAFDLSLGKPLDNYPLVRSALLALRLVLAGVTAHEATVLLRSPYLSGGVAEAAARARLALEVRRECSGEVTAQTLTDLLRPSGRCPLLARSLAEAQAVMPRRNQRLRPSDWATSIKRLLDAVGWAHPADGERALNSPEFQALSSWTSLLETLASLDAVLPPLSLPELLARLGRMAAGQLFQPENSGAPVQIMGPIEAAGSVFDHLWIAGATDDALPAHAPPNPLLPLDAQRRAGVPHASVEQELAFGRLLVSRLAASAPDVIVSWPMRDQDRDLRPSPLVASFSSCPLDEAGAGPAAPRWAEWPASAPCEEFPAGDAPPLQNSGTLRGGTALFELQSNCPFHAFADRRLGARPLDSAQIGFDPMQRGHIVERALELCWLQLREQSTLETIAAPDLERILGDAARQAVAEVAPAGDVFAERLGEIEQRRIVELVREWLQMERKREWFKVFAHQQSVELEAGGVRVKGQIDRIDQMADGHLVVLDYKSGKGLYGRSQWNGDRPRRAQLPLYAINQTMPVCGVAFALVRRGKSQFSGFADRPEILGGKSKMRDDDLTLADRIAGWRNALSMLGQQYAAGKAAVDPLPQACDNCRLHALCRVAEQQRPLADDSTEEDADE